MVQSLKAKADQPQAHASLRQLDALSILEVRIGSGKYGTATEAIAETNKRLAAEGCAPLMPESEKAVNEAHAARHQMAEMLKRQHGLVEAELKSGAGTKGRPMEFEGIITVAKQGIEKLNSSANVFLAGLEMKNGRGQALASKRSPSSLPPCSARSRSPDAQGAETQAHALAKVR